MPIDKSTGIVNTPDGLKEKPKVFVLTKDTFKSSGLTGNPSNVSLFSTWNVAPTSSTAVMLSGCALRG